MGKKILILGAGEAQIDAIKYCKNKGLKVSGCSYTDNDPGIPLLDYFEQVDIKDINGVAELADRLKADLVYSVGSDLAVPTAMRVSELLELPHFISSETASTCHAKHLMRSALGTEFPGNAAFIVCETLEEALTFSDFPGMMKPVDSQGQRGCFRVDSREDIEAHFAASLDYSIEGKVIIETFIDGPEVSVNAYFQEGLLRFALISDRFVFNEYPGGIIREHRVPSEFTDLSAKEEILELVKNSAAKLRINNGPCYYQIKLNAQNHPIILEIAPRLDGCHMWDLIKHYCGADLLDACFTHLTENRPVLTDTFAFHDENYQLKFICKKTGSVFDRSEYDLSGAEAVRWFCETGDIVRKMNGYMEKCGYIIRKTYINN